MSDEYLFISDCHVDASKPEVTANLIDFLQNRAKNARFLYILGDLFETWIGDDAHNPDNDDVINSLRALAETTKIFFLAGNRDFLLGDEGASNIGFIRIAEPSFLQLGEHRVALLHGDTLCTDDIDYQSFRRMVRDPNWQAQFLQQPLAQRQALAAQLRAKSAEAMANKSFEIMDVNTDAVAQFFSQSSAQIIIHGHTHRPAVHQYDDNRLRYVLGDWNPQPSYISWSSESGFILHDSRVG